ncbi:MAG: YdcF family protein [Nitrospirae bacterium]|nr:YdcF family protein [Nitrospirota bacterium]
MLLKSIGLIFINPLVYLLAGLIFLVFTKKTRKVFTFFLALFFYLFSISFTSYWFLSYWAVEDTYKPKEKYDAAVVLAGVLDVGWHAYHGSQFYVPENFIHSTENIERILAGLYFVKIGQAGELLFGEWTYYSFNEGQKVKMFLIAQGIKENRIILYAKVNRTIDEARGVKAYAQKRQMNKILLITSQFHMRRSLAMFKKHGLKPDTFSTSKRTPGQLHLTHFVPTWKGIGNTLDCIYELAAYGFYFAKGDLLP